MKFWKDGVVLAQIQEILKMEKQTLIKIDLKPCISDLVRIYEQLGKMIAAKY